MTVCPEPHEIRTLVHRILRQLGLSDHDLATLRETIPLDAGRYVARTYRAGDMMAMWLVEVGILQFYDADGNMLQTINLLDELKPIRLAA
jgi:hypothetical protein